MSLCTGSLVGLRLAAAGGAGRASAVLRLGLRAAPQLGAAAPVRRALLHTSPCQPALRLGLSAAPSARSSILAQLRQLHSTSRSPAGSASLSADAAAAYSEPAAATAAATASAPADSHYSDGTSPWVAAHLIATFVLVYAIIVVGGLTRLTESGLSITEWNPGMKGMRLPSSQAEWEAEWEKYKGTPEFVLLNQHMTLDDFKTIYGWEWGHRMLGRFIGVFFVVPALAFALTGAAGRRTRWKLLAIASGIGFQGALGWYMVKSGLTAPEIAPTHPNSTARPDGQQRLDADSKTAEWTPRVSHFRLAAHLGTAFLVGLGCLHTAAVILRPGMHARLASPLAATSKALAAPSVRRYATGTRAITAFVFFTAISGALVAGLDAGLVYNEFPTMGDGRIAPPMDELMEDKYALHDPDAAPGAGRSTWRTAVGNFTSNPVAVQLAHRTLAISSLVLCLGVGWRGARLARIARAQGNPLPPAVPRLAVLAASLASLQASLGICTLIYLVPIELASAHQAGAVALLSSLVALVASLRRGPKTLAQPLAAAAARPREQVVAQALRNVAKPRAATQPSL